MSEDAETGQAPGAAGERQRAHAGSLKDRASRAIGSLLASPRFHRWAAAFPPFRPIARRQARALFDLCAGFVYSQVLSACVRLRLFDMLAEGPQDRASLARRLGLGLEATERLLDAAVALRLATRPGEGRYGLGMLGAAVLANPGIAAMVEHHDLLYADLADPLALLRGEKSQTALGDYWAYARRSRSDDLEQAGVDAYTTLMATSQQLVADDILAAYPFERHQCLLDVGGGDGSFLAAVAARAPRLRLMLFDLPPVAERARARFVGLGLGERVQAFGGDFTATPLPTGADVVSLVRVVHDHDDAKVLALLRAVRAALPPDGTLVIAEPMAGVPGAEAMGDAYFGFYLLAMGSGRPRTVARLTEMLKATGFDAVKQVPTRIPLKTSIVVARCG